MIYMSHYKYKKHTTTTLIELLKENEHGAVSGRSRELTFWVNGRPYNWVVIDGWGDGLVTDVGLYLKNDEQVAKLKPDHPHKPRSNK